RYIIGLSIGTGKCRVCEVVVAQREVTGETPEPLLENIGHGRCAAGERIILSRRNAKPEERRLAADHPLDQPLFEQWCNILIKEQALLAQGAGAEHRLGVDTVGARNGVAHADETAEQAALVDVALEMGNPPSSLPAALLPISPGCSIKMRRKMTAVGREVLRLIGFAEEAVEFGPAGQPAGTGNLEPGQC